MKKLIALIQPLALPLAWLQVTVAMAGSLYFSEVLHYVPCNLCWYQRIAMYPLVLILGIAMLRGDKKVTSYATPLAAIGWLFAAYQNLLYYHLIPESIALCTNSVPCTTHDISLLGFIGFPLLSLAAFTITILLLAISRDPRKAVLE